MLAGQGQQAIDGLGLVLIQVHALETTCFGLREQVFGYEHFKERIEEFQDAQMKIVDDKVAKLDADLLEMACSCSKVIIARFFDIDIRDYREEWNINVSPFEEPLHIPVSCQVGEDVVDSTTTYHPTNSQEPVFSPIMDTISQDHEDFCVLSKEEEECLDSLEELVYYIEQDVEVTYTDLNPPQMPQVVINNLGKMA
nr:hypothetical protein [Tanacetum cinerariifolium]